MTKPKVFLYELLEGVKRVGMGGGVQSDFSWIWLLEEVMEESKKDEVEGT